MMNSDLWVLEWSQRSNCFHVQPLERTLSFNRGLYTENKKTVNDWRVLFVGTQAECSETADASRATLQARESQYGPKE